MQFFVFFLVWATGFYNHDNLQIADKKLISPVASVKLLAFKGKADGNKNLLEWQTTSETDTREYIIERAVDNNGFTLLAWVSPKGTILGSAFYRYTDTISNKKTHYRLRMVAANGKEQLSSIVTISRNGK